jgi:hypothetical protein
MERDNRFCLEFWEERIALFDEVPLFRNRLLDSLLIFKAIAVQGGFHYRIT